MAGTSCICALWGRSGNAGRRDGPCQVQEVAGEWGGMDSALDLHACRTCSYHMAVPINDTRINSRVFEIVLLQSAVGAHGVDGELQTPICCLTTRRQHGSNGQLHDLYLEASPVSGIYLLFCIWYLMVLGTLFLKDRRHLVP